MNTAHDFTARGENYVGKTAKERGLPELNENDYFELPNGFVGRIDGRSLWINFWQVRGVCGPLMVDCIDGIVEEKHGRGFWLADSHMRWAHKISKEEAMLRAGEEEPKYKPGDKVLLEMTIEKIDEQGDFWMEELGGFLTDEELRQCIAAAEKRLAKEPDEDLGNVSWLNFRKGDTIKGPDGLEHVILVVNESCQNKNSATHGNARIAVKGNPPLYAQAIEQSGTQWLSNRYASKCVLVRRGS